MLDWNWIRPGYDGLQITTSAPTLLIMIEECTLTRSSLWSSAGGRSLKCCNGDVQVKLQKVDTRGGGGGFQNFVGFSLNRQGLPASFWRNAVRWGLGVDPVMPQELHGATVHIMTRDSMKAKIGSACQ
jgi:hypothetical protein